MGKPLSEYLKYYQTHSSTASSVSRQAAYAAIAVIWIFKEENSLPEKLILVAVLILLGLVLDFLQYVWASAAWGIFHRLKEKKRVEEKLNMNASPWNYINIFKEKKCDNISAPAWINWPTLFCFWGKLIAIAIGYFFLLRFLIQALNINT